MTTHERELTAEVDLCTADGLRLNPDAVGWSRRPLHRANLGGFGRNKRWDYWAVLAGDVVVSSVYADVDHLGLADVWWADLAGGASGGHAIVTVGSDDFDLPERPGQAPRRVHRDGLDLDVVDGDAWGVLDVGRGRWPAEVTWNWGGGAGRSGGHVVGLQFGAKWTEGSGHTENGFLVDGRLTKLGNELDWRYDWDEPMAPWRVVDPGGQLDVTLTPRFDKHTKLPGRDRGSETHQVFGTWSGTIRTDDGTELRLEGIQGFAEEARQEW